MELMERMARRQLVIEVSERSVTNVAQMRVFQQKLDQLGIEFAYDDFGSGQARLLRDCQLPRMSPAEIARPGFRLQSAPGYNQVRGPMENCPASQMPE